MNSSHTLPLRADSSPDVVSAGGKVELSQARRLERAVRRSSDLRSDVTGLGARGGGGDEGDEEDIKIVEVRVV